MKQYYLDRIKNDRELIKMCKNSYTRNILNYPNSTLKLLIENIELAQENIEWCEDRLKTLDTTEYNRTRQTEIGVG